MAAHRADAGGCVHPPDGRRRGQFPVSAPAASQAFSLDRMLAVLVKEFIQLTRDRITYALILAVPVIQMLLFGYAINTDPRHLPTAVLVQENSVFARSVVSAMANSSYFDIVRQARSRSEEHTSELQSRRDLVCRLLLEKKNT